MDYLAPQLYWPIDSPEQSFRALLKWWAEQNIKGRHLFAGLDATKANGKWKPRELVDQIRLTRQQNGSPGHVHWDIKALFSNRTLAAVLQREVYSEPALAPSCPWLGETHPATPKLNVVKGATQRQVRIQWEPGGNEVPRLWLLQTRSGGVWKIEILPGETRVRSWDASPPDVIALSAVRGNISAAAVVQIRKG